MRPLTFGYTGKWSQNYTAVQQAAHLVKSGPTPVGVEIALPPTGLALYPGFYYPPPAFYRVATNQEYIQAALGRRLVWTAVV